MRAKSFLIGALLVLSALSGCGPFWVDPYITVKESPLNWVDIHYYNTNRKPIRRVAVYINGLGLVELRKGTSDRVSNDFAKSFKSETWRDIRTQRLYTDPKHVNDLFQNLVNHGLLDKEKTFKGSDKEKFDRFIAVKANINNNTYSETQNIFEVDPDLAEQLLDVVREFDNPTLR
ncbi:MAG TPA: hypothetical protein DD637_06525 [Verrucomicrobia bacterium]|nr:hypothetical protein [Verrucomicrobiota bacterium]HBO99472.1 hypothetical protein [Verrucomicrobiota bacterium]